MANNKYMTNLEKYIASLLHAKKMKELGIIKDNEFNKIDLKLRKKYCIKNNSIYISNEWINTLFRDNM